MAYSSAAVSARELAAAALDYPQLGGKNVVRSVDASGSSWRTSGSWATGSEAQAVGYEARWGHDGYGTGPTRPSSAQLTWYYLLKWAAGAPDIDRVLILGLAGCSGVTVSLELANDNAFTSGLIQLASWAVTTEKRLAALVLKHTGTDALRYSLAPYARLKFTKGTTFVPEFTELVLDRRRQLMHKPDAPWAGLDSVTSGFGESVSLGGIITRNENFAGGIQFNGDLQSNDSLEQADLRAWAKETRWGVRPWAYVENPTSEPNRVLYGFAGEPGFAMPNPPGFPSAVRDFSFSFVESAPFLLEEEA